MSLLSFAIIANVAGVEFPISFRTAMPLSGRGRSPIDGRTGEKIGAKPFDVRPKSTVTIKPRLQWHPQNVALLFDTKMFQISVVIDPEIGDVIFDDAKPPTMMQMKAAIVTDVLAPSVIAPRATACILKVEHEPMRRERGIKDRHASVEFGSWIVCHVLVLASNGCNQRLATLDEPHHRILSRVRCIALFYFAHAGGEYATSST